MKNITRYAWSLLLLLGLHSASFGMQNNPLMTAMGNYYYEYLEGQTNADKIYYLLLALRRSTAGTPEHQLLKDALMVQGFDADNADIENFIVSYITQEYKLTLQQPGTQQEKINLIKWRIQRANDPLVQQALQAILNKLESGEI